MPRYTWGISISGLCDPQTGRRIRICGRHPKEDQPNKLPPKNLIMAGLAQDIEGLADGADVSEWTGIRSRWTIEQPAIGDRPTWEADDSNGLNASNPVVRFNGSEFLEVTGSLQSETPIFESGNFDPFTVIMGVEIIAAAGGHTLWAMGWRNNGSEVQVRLLPGTNTLQVRYDANGANESTSVTWDGSYGIVTVCYDGSDLKVRLNQGAWSSFTPSDELNPDGMLIGAVGTTGWDASVVDVMDDGLVSGFAVYREDLSADPEKLNLAERYVDFWGNSGNALSYVNPSVIYWEGLVSYPRIIERSIEPVSGVVSQSTMTFELGSIGEDDRIGSLVRDFLTSSSPRQWATLGAALNTGGLTLTYLPKEGVSAADPRKLLYLEREVLLIRDTPVAIAGGKFTVTVQRGRGGTDDVDHPFNALSDIAIFDRNPVVPTREVEVYRRDATSETLEFSGLLESPNDESESAGTRLSISVRDNLSFLSGRRLGYGRIVAYGSPIRTERNGRWILGGEGFFENLISSVRRAIPNFVPIQFADPVGPVLTSYTVLRAGDVIAAAPMRLEKFPYQDPNGIDVWTVAWLRGPQPLRGHISDVPERGGRGSQSHKRCHEVLVTDPNYTYFVNEDGNLIGDSSYDYPYHPFDILRCILASTGEMVWPKGNTKPTPGSNGTFDVLPRHWGLGVPNSQIAHDDFEALKRTWPFSDLQMRNFVMGNDENPIDAREWVQDFCASFYTFLTVDGQGRLTIRSLFDTNARSLGEINTQDIVENTFSYKQAESPPLYEIEIQCARAWPKGDDLDSIIETEIRGETSRRYLHQVEDLKVESPHFGDPESLKMTSRVRRALIALFGDLWHLRNTPPPIYHFSLGPDFERVEPGSRYNLTFNGTFNGDGGLSISGHQVFVMNSGFSIETGEQRLKVMDLFYLTRGRKRIAPLFKIQTVNETDDVDIEQAFCTTGDNVTYPDGDWGLWVDGAQVLLVNKNLEIRDATANTGTMQLTAGSPNGNILFDATFSVTPAVGDYLVPTNPATDTGWNDEYAIMLGVGDTDYDLWQ